MFEVWVNGIFSCERETYESAKDLVVEKNFSESKVVIKKDDCILFSNVKTGAGSSQRLI